MNVVTNGMENGFEDFWQRFSDLQDEAKTYGVASIVILHEYDPIAKDTGHFIRYTTGLDLGIGLCEVAKKEMLDATTLRHEEG